MQTTRNTENFVKISVLTYARLRINFQVVKLTARYAILHCTLFSCNIYCINTSSIYLCSLWLGDAAAAYADSGQERVQNIPWNVCRDISRCRPRVIKHFSAQTNIKFIVSVTTQAICSHVNL